MNHNPGHRRIFCARYVLIIVLQTVQLPPDQTFVRHEHLERKPLDRPHAEWREGCMRTFGVPISACSYFQFEEFPALMGAFYIIHFLVVTGVFLVQVRGARMLCWCASKCVTWGESRFHRPDGGAKGEPLETRALPTCLCKV